MVMRPKPPPQEGNVVSAREVEEGATVREGIPVSPSLGPALAAADVPVEAMPVDRRVVLISLISIGVGASAAVIAWLLLHLIWLITNISFHGSFTFAHGTPPGDPMGTPMGSHVGWWVVIIPAIGGVIVGYMARYGSKAIRGHGIPEAMEVVLLNQSRIPPRLTFLKPLSAAFAIGTGGPFGAEGPIIATGGALGSLIGQLMPTTAAERKTLLAAGAAAGMAATFGSPVSAVLLAIELLLFEFRARSIIPVAMASATAAAVRWAFDGSHAIFHLPNLTQPGGEALTLYILIGAIVGVCSVFATRVVYFIEDGFEALPVHWMWWPAIGGLVVGLIGYFYPRTLGVGYYNISDILSNAVGGGLGAVALLALWKFISWSVSLGSGTSGGTLAPLFTIGGAIGAVLGAGAMHFIPVANVDIRIAALVGMAAMFAGASRALLTSAVFAFETTLQPLGLLPLLGGCTASFLVSALLMRNTIMTEKIARRGIKVPADYEADFLDQARVKDVSSKSLITLKSMQTIESVRSWISSRSPDSIHQGYPVIDEGGHLLGVLTRRLILDPSTPPGAKLAEMIHRPPVVVYDDNTLRDAADHMVNHEIGRLPVIERRTGRLIGMVTRSDLLGAHRKRLREHREATATLNWFGRRIASSPPLASNGDQAKTARREVEHAGSEH
jgi:H+/Cl- antiporter ClcA